MLVFCIVNIVSYLHKDDLYVCTFAWCIRCLCMYVFMYVCGWPFCTVTARPYYTNMWTYHKYMHSSVLTSRPCFLGQGLILYPGAGWYILPNNRVEGVVAYFAAYNNTNSYIHTYSTYKHTLIPLYLHPRVYLSWSPMACANIWPHEDFNDVL